MVSHGALLVWRSNLASRHLKSHSPPKSGGVGQVILFVVGGIGLGELRAARKAVSERAAAAAARGQRPPPHVLLGGTALLAPADVVTHLLCS